MAESDKYLTKDEWDEKARILAENTPQFTQDFHQIARDNYYAKNNPNPTARNFLGVDTTDIAQAANIDRPTSFGRWFKDLWGAKEEDNEANPFIPKVSEPQPEDDSANVQRNAELMALLNRRSNLAGQVRKMQDGYEPLKAPTLEGYDNSEYEDELRSRLGQRSDQVDLSPFMNFMDSVWGTQSSRAYQRPQDKLNAQNQRDLQLLSKINRLGRDDIDIANQNAKLAYDNDARNISNQRAMDSQLLQAMGQDQAARSRQDRLKLQLLGGGNKKDDKFINGYRPKDITREIDTAVKSGGQAEPAMTDMEAQATALAIAAGNDKVDPMIVKMKIRRDMENLVPKYMREKGLTPTQAVYQFYDEFMKDQQQALEKLQQRDE